jgi:Ni/Co efflux regulator RcnB
MRVHIFDYERRTLAAGGHGSKWLRVNEMDE